MPASTVYLNDYQPPVFSVETVNLNFDLYDDHVLVNSELKLKRQTKGVLMLYGEELELVNLQLNGRELVPDNYRLEDGNLIIEDCPDTCTVQIVTRIYPQKNSKLSGLYRSNALFCTQCEAQGFRRISFFPDRPDVLAIYSTRISADKEAYPVLLSNGNLIASGDLENGRHWAYWEDPFKKPSYLFALVAGRLSCVTDSFISASSKEIRLAIYVEPGNEDKCAHAMTSLKKAMRWDELEYGREYDLAIFMIVAVSDFNMGAMENKGLNIFNSKYILARPDTATDQDFANIESVVAHEYFHNWTGNRVTCRDWFQLSLKEGLTVFRDQEFSRDMNSRDVNRILDVKALRNTQFPEDAGSMAHPVRPSSYQEINNFYTATIYNKGAEVIRMQQTLLGKEGFRKGMDLYFERHDGQAVTIEDFVAAMEDANAVDFTQFKRWYSQAGTPEVTVKSHYSNETLTITLTQNCPPTAENSHKKPFHIPIRITLFTEEGQQIPLKQELLELREVEQQFEFPNLMQKPLFSLLADFSAPIKLQRQMETEEWLSLLRVESNGYAKWDTAQCLALHTLEQCYHNPSLTWQIPERLLEVYKEILLDERLDLALRAELLMPPSFEEVAAILPRVDVDAVEAVRDFFRQALGSYLFEEAHRLYQTLWQVEDHAMNGAAYGRRKLRNVCLWLMMKADEKRSLVIADQQFLAAKTMTDQIASFALLANCSELNKRESAISNFYHQWSHDELVLDKWFAIQASCEAPGTLNAVKKLLEHPAFNLKNPNKVRAVVGAFTQANPRHFHALDGSGYVFLTEMLIALDPLNPQIAARLATPLTRWQGLDNKRQDLMQQQLIYLTKRDLSRDLQEMVTKSLNIEG